MPSSKEHDKGTFGKVLWIFPATFKRYAKTGEGRGV